ncbi:hypothetical protein WJU23_12295 [Prosthecobacter sp. SYSU 5D2]|uniref:Trm112 family protein n=1 Tax=Prosthecobacter sp. SYSU 5D2 TaxID=3134134 RepID=UPI0031FED6BF
MDLSWIDDFLPTFRCPHTHQTLRWATAEDLLHHQHPAEKQALVSEDGSRLFPIEEGIPVLLP